MGALVPLSGARAADAPYYGPAQSSRLPACEAASVQAAVGGSLAREAHYSGTLHTVMGLENIRELANHTNGISPLERRYCTGLARLTDGSQHTVYYKLVEHAGFVGLSWNVEACFAPFDKWRVYGASCSTVRPR
nr:cytoplasmic protein [Roseibium litorale]